jgi:hypothetical protein
VKTVAVSDKGEGRALIPALFPIQNLGAAGAAAHWTCFYNKLMQHDWLRKRACTLIKYKLWKVCGDGFIITRQVQV